MEGELWRLSVWHSQSRVNGKRQFSYLYGSQRGSNAGLGDYHRNLRYGHYQISVCVNHDYINRTSTSYIDIVCHATAIVNGD